MTTLLLAEHDNKVLKDATNKALSAATRGITFLPVVVEGATMAS